MLDKKVKVKTVKVKLIKGDAQFSLRQVALFVVAFGIIGGFIVLKSFAAPANGGGNKTPTTPPPPLSSAVSQNWTNDPGKWIANDKCFGVDNQATWGGVGTLAPGETYTFNPAYPTCAPSEIPTIMMHVDWTGATNVEMKSKVAFVEEHNYSPVITPQVLSKTLTSRTTVAPNSKKQANLCEFTDAMATGEQLGLPTMTYHTGQVYPVPINWSATITNTGTQTATVNFSGQEQNGWEGYYYPHCNRADSDGDHWNDSLEESILNLGATNNVATGSDYLSGLTLKDPNTTTVSATPADFNSDDVIDSKDVAMIQQYLGKGNSNPQDQIDPNAGCSQSNSITLDTPCQGIWRRFDIDGDGVVTAHDVSEVQSLVGKSLPLQADYLAPWAVIEAPDTVPANYGGYYLHAFASDNDMLTHVDIYAAGKLLCSTWGSPDNYGRTGQGLWFCAWYTPRKSGVASLITVNAYDDAGHVYSATKTITTQ